MWYISHLLAAAASIGLLIWQTTIAAELTSGNCKNAYINMTDGGETVPTIQSIAVTEEAEMIQAMAYISISLFAFGFVWSFMPVGEDKDNVFRLAGPGGTAFMYYTAIAVQLVFLVFAINEYRDWAQIRKTCASVDKPATCDDATATSETTPTIYEFHCAQSQEQVFAAALSSLILMCLSKAASDYQKPGAGADALSGKFDASNGYMM